MQCLIALDGISSGDLNALLELLPRSRALLQDLSETKLDCSSNSAQSIWAELLTGTKPFANGCGGYAFPTSSLNKLEVFSEKNLLVPARLVEVKAPAMAAIINVPLLMPRVSERFWLSDGSLPINRNTSPPDLRLEEEFRRYSPRPYKSHAGATTQYRSAVVEACLNSETNRLDCAISLFKRGGWGKFLYRLSIFDYVSHLIGLNFLRATDLKIYRSIQEFLRRFDEALQLFASEKSVKLSVVSGFAHVFCEGTLNLNLTLAHGGFLKLKGKQVSSNELMDRTRAISAISKTTPTTHFLATLEGQIDTSQTVAASPVSGCVYINKSTVFDDGIVNENDYKNVRNQVFSYLKKVLSDSGRDHSIDVHPDEVNNSLAPDIIVKIEGIEFQNLSATMSPITPLTTHSTSGFALLSPDLNAPHLMSTRQLASLLND